MPWAIRRQGAKWVVVTAATGKVMGHHPSLVRAKRQVRALYANMPDVQKVVWTEDSTQWVPFRLRKENPYHRGPGPGGGQFDFAPGGRFDLGVNRGPGSLGPTEQPSAPTGPATQRFGSQNLEQSELRDVGAPALRFEVPVPAPRKPDLWQVAQLNNGKWAVIGPNRPDFENGMAQFDTEEEAKQRAADANDWATRPGESEAPAGPRHPGLGMPIPRPPGEAGIHVEPMDSVVYARMRANEALAAGDDVGARLWNERGDQWYAARTPPPTPPTPTPGSSASATEPTHFPPHLSTSPTDWRHWQGIRTASNFAQWPIPSRLALAPVVVAPADPKATSFNAREYGTVSDQSISSDDNLGGGVSEVRLLTDTNGKKWVFKPLSGERGGLRDEIKGRGDQGRREAATAEIAHLVGWGSLVPPAGLVTIGGRAGVVKPYVEGTIALHFTDMRQAVKSFPKQERERAMFLSYVMGNTDMHEGNWMRGTDGHMRLIDNGLVLSHAHTSLRIPKDWVRSGGQISRKLQATWEGKEAQFDAILNRYKIKDGARDLFHERLKTATSARKWGDLMDYESNGGYGWMGW
jgi:hypothetical protein